MIEHYNAFISYRHAEKDIEVARSIQRDLEHFHIPMKLRKAHGMKAIDRIFLDKDELGTASDLSSEIAYALEHADFLIVICSTSTKESQWVPREIEYFLRNHTRKQITTVLVDGEPDEVIPDILKYEYRTYTNEQGQSYTVPVRLEPLSCDYRLPRKTAKREELPRLASSLIGCSYDELMNRRRQYRVRRMSLIFNSVLAAVIIAVIGIYLNHRKLQETYQNALMNQSKYLAHESMHANENEQRILALQLALAALPTDEEDSRPVIPEAIRALTDATLAYTSLMGNSIEAVWNYSMDNTMSQYEISPSASAIAALDTSGSIKVWDTASHTVLLALPKNTTASVSIHFPTDDILLVQDRFALTAYQLKTGSSLWTYESKDGFSYDNTFPAFKDGSFLVGTGVGTILRLSREDGSVMDKYTIRNENTNPFNITLSPNEEMIACTIMNNAAFQSQISVYDLKKKTCVTGTDSIDRIRDLCWADDTHLMASIPANSMGGSLSAADTSYLEPDHTTIHCMDPVTMKDIWTYDFVTTDVIVKSAFLALPKTESIAYYSGDKAEILKLKDGELTASHVVNSPIVDISDRDGNGWPTYITRDGSLAIPAGKDSVKLLSCLTDNLDWAIINQHIFVHSSGSKDIIQYQLYVHDENWKEIQGSKSLASFYQTFYMEDAVLAMVTKEESGKFPSVKTTEETIPILTLIDLMGGRLQYQIPLVDEKGEPLAGNDYNWLGTVNNTFYLSFTAQSTSELTLAGVDLGTGELKLTPLLEKAFFYSDIRRYGNNIYYLDQDEDFRVRVNEYDITTGKTQGHIISDELQYASTTSDPIYLPGLNAVYYTHSEGDWIVYMDGKDSQHLPKPENWSETTHVTYNEKTHCLAVTDGFTIQLINMDSLQVVKELPCPGSRPLALSFYDPKDTDEPTLLLVPYSNGLLYRYQANTGEYVGNSDISVYRSDSYEAQFDYMSSDNTLYIQIYDLTDVINLDSWVEEGCIRNSLGHHRLTNRFYTYSYKNSGENHIGYFSHYTTEELIQRAKDILKDTKMSDEMKSIYGIEDTP